MRIYTKAGDLAFRTFTFPDGQPHFSLETYEQEFDTVTLEVAIKSPCDLFTTLLASDVLRQHGYANVNLDVRYLMGARMDRAINASQPFTLQTVSRLVNSAGFNRVRILDVHSDVATRLIRNSTNVLPYRVVQQVVATLGEIVIAVPDKGAIYRVQSLTGIGTGLTNRPLIYCEKKREMATGKLSGFKVLDYPGHLPSRVLVVDDICDGGGTFTGLAKELRQSGATEVNLFVTHGIFSKGLPLEGIDHVYTTDSYVDGLNVRNSQHRPFENCSTQSRGFTVIPVSMKEMKE